MRLFTTSISIRRLGSTLTGWAGGGSDAPERCRVSAYVHPVCIWPDGDQASGMQTRPSVAAAGKDPQDLAHVGRVVAVGPLLEVTAECGDRLVEPPDPAEE